MKRSTEMRSRCGGERFKFGEGPHGHGRGPWSRARRGNVRAAILSALSDEPMHGYQIMQLLEERSGGMWRPSPGSVYPTLQMLEDEGLVKGQEMDGRRVFTLTEAGRAAAAESRQTHGAPWEHGEGQETSPQFRLRRSLFQLGAAVKQVGTAGTPAQVDEALRVLGEARKRLYTLLAEGD